MGEFIFKANSQFKLNVIIVDFMECLILKKRMENSLLDWDYYYHLVVVSFLSLEIGQRIRFITVLVAQILLLQSENLIDKINENELYFILSMIKKIYN